MGDKDQSKEIPDQVLRNILAEMDEHKRLKTLTNEELVMECIQDPYTDCPVVEEMCRRLLPNWAEEGH